MPSDLRDDLRVFRDYIDGLLASGRDDLTLDDVLAPWEYEHSTEEEREDTIRAIRRGLDDMHAGRTRPAEEVLAELRREFGPRPKPEG